MEGILVAPTGAAVEPSLEYVLIFCFYEPCELLLLLLTYLESHVDPCADFGEAILSRTMALDSVSMVRPISS